MLDSHTNNILIKIGSAANASFAANPNYRQSQVNMNPQVKRMSKTHEMAVDIIKVLVQTFVKSRC